MGGSKNFSLGSVDTLEVQGAVNVELVKGNSNRLTVFYSGETPSSLEDIGASENRGRLTLEGNDIVNISGGVYASQGNVVITGSGNSSVYINGKLVGQHDNSDISTVVEKVIVELKDMKNLDASGASKVTGEVDRELFNVTASGASKIDINSRVNVGRIASVSSSGASKISS